MMFSSDNNALIYFSQAISHPISHPYILIQTQPQVQEYVMFYTPQQISNASALMPPYYPFGVVTIVDEMTVEQTSRWIFTFGSHRGWPQQEEYAEAFKKNNIHGEILCTLTDDMLESDLEIKNQTHRNELLSAIQRLLYPDTMVGSAGKSTEPVIGKPPSESSIGNPYTTCQPSMNSIRMNNNLPPGYACSISTYEPTQMDEAMSVSCFSQTSISASQAMSVRSSSTCNAMMTSVCDVNDNNEKTQQIFTPFKSRKLLLTLEDEQIENECPMKSIRSRFQELHMDVEVLKTKDKANTFTLVFPNNELATEALQSTEIEYTLKKMWPPRATPKSPKSYKALDDLEVRQGKAMSWDVLYTLAKGTEVTVNQVKGRRARMCGEHEGWVSLHEPSGKTLLARLGDF